MKKEIISYERLQDAAVILANKINLALAPLIERSQDIRIYPVPRGGVPAALALMAADRRGACYTLVSDPSRADCIVDDLLDSGKTMDKHAFHNQIRAVLFTKDPRTDILHGRPVTPGQWTVFPWEGSDDSNDTSAEDIPVRLLQFIGEDVEREGLQDTPRRFLEAWKEYTDGYNVKPEDVLKTFEDGADGVDEMVLVKDISFYSHCEHHLAPFFGTVHVSYIPDGKIVGLSKIARLVDIFAARLQVQERFTQQIANALQDNLSPKGVGVVVEARHMCMESRGVRRSGSSTVTSAMRGVMLDNPSARAELLSLVRK